MIKTIMRKVRFKPKSAELSIALPSDFLNVFDSIKTHVSIQYDNKKLMDGMTIKVVK